MSLFIGVSTKFPTKFPTTVTGIHGFGTGSNYAHSMATADDKLKNFCDQLKKGVVPPKETVRAFLLWFGASRRGARVVR
jgi:hypothetical protein